MFFITLKSSNVWFLWFFSRVSLEVFSPAQQILLGNSYMSLRFFFLPFLYFSSFWNLKNCFYQFLLYFSVFFSSLGLVFLQIYYPLISLFLSLYSVCFSLMFYNCLICFLSVILHLVRALHIYLSAICFALVSVSLNTFLIYSCSLSLFSLPFIVSSVFFLFFSMLHLDLACALSVVLFPVSSPFLYILLFPFTLSLVLFFVLFPLYYY